MDWSQIAVGMSDSRIGEKVTATLLKKVFGRAQKAAADSADKAIVEAELESMSDTTSAQYGIPPEAFAKWRRRWARG